MRSRALPAVAVALAALLTVGLAPAAAALGAPWTVRSVLSLGTDTTAVACSSTSACWAVEAGQLLSSADAGQHWADRTDLLPAGVDAIQDVSCPAGSAHCYFTATTTTGPTVLRLYQNQLTRLAVPATATVAAISCTTAIRCVATDGTDSYVTTDGGQSWSTNPLVAIVYTEPGLDCFRTSCWIVGDRGETPLIEYSSDGGLTWTAQTAPTNTDGLYAISCPSLTTCYAGGATMTPDDATIIATHNRGRTWTVEPVPAQAYAVRSIDCRSTTACTAVGYSPGYTAFVFALINGTWTRQTVAQTATSTAAAVACPAVGTCTIVAGGLGYYTTDGGTTWTDQPLPVGLEAPQSLSCPSTSHCVAVGNSAGGQPQLSTSNDGGATWTEHAAPPGLGTLWGVDCPSTSTCLAVSAGLAPGTNRTVSHGIVSHDGGVTWSVSKMTGAAGLLRGLSCPSVTTCLASGYDNHSAAKLMATTDGGASWHALTPPAGFYLDGVACAAVDSCVIVSHDPNQPLHAWTTSDLGQTYASHPFPELDAVDGIDCGGSYCVAGGFVAGDGGLVTSTDGGADWTPVTLPAGVQEIGQVSCGSSTACAAAAFDFSQGGGPYVLSTHTAGASWTLHRVPARQEMLIDIACAGTHCLGSDVASSGNPVIVAGTA